MQEGMRTILAAGHERVRQGRKELGMASRSLASLAKSAAPGAHHVLCHAHPGPMELPVRTAKHRAYLG